ncbi:LysR family transcriptional regulator [Glutamicibacter sp. NPDC087344]|uniref:LysR family transcriptional regulator n=1 Tax=Glutamicibacter sp. NPDC087344 TaxID=3363994 RepID=UPI00381F837E
MDARQLRYFLAVVDYDGFIRAAEHLLIAQPSLSQTIKTLEREIGVPLFHRVGRRALLSEAGRELVGPARLVLRDLEAAEDAMAALKGVRRGRLDLVAMPSPAVEPLTTLISQYSVRHPHVVVNTSAAFTAAEVISSVQSGSSEIGLLGTDKPITVQDANVLPLERQPMVLLANPRHTEFSDRQSITGEELEGQRLVVSQRGSLMRAQVDELLARGVGLVIAAEVAHRSSLLPLVLAGVGHAILPEAWAPMARHAGVHVVRLLPAVDLHISLISRRQGLTPAARAFVEVAEAYAATSNDMDR